MLKNVNSPDDLKKLKKEDLPQFCDELRTYLIDILSARGGHVGPNLGALEVTTALHYVFNSPLDKIVFDVSHQCYTHKILTGRKEAMLDLHITKEINGYTDFSESAHDHFRMGHTSTSISLSSGLAKARDLAGEKYNVISLIGDGSLSGGEAFEGLNVAANLNSNFIIIVNDNEYSIDKNSGGLYKNLAELRASNGSSENNYFKVFGYDYVYVENGNSVLDLVEAFQKVKDSTHPVVVHIHTKKAKGLPFAEADETHWHYSGPFDKLTGAPLKSAPKNEDSENPPEPKIEHTSAFPITLSFLEKALAENSRSFVLIPGAPALGDSIKLKFPAQYVDTGIAEEQAVAMLSGAGKGGSKAYLAVNSPFIQRAYDQVIIDWAANENPGVMLVLWAGVSAAGFADYTHAGMYDIAMLSNVPGLTYITPASADEYAAMLEFSKGYNKPLAIRVGNGSLPKIASGGQEIAFGKFETINAGSEIALLGLGGFYEKALEVAALLKKKGFNPTVINPRFINVLDEKLLDSLIENHKIIATIEDGIIDGGFGQKVSSYLSAKKGDFRILNFGGKREFVNNLTLDEIYTRNHLHAEQIAEDILKTER